MFLTRANASNFQSWLPASNLDQSTPITAFVFTCLHHGDTRCQFQTITRQSEPIYSENSTKTYSILEYSIWYSLMGPPLRKIDKAVLISELSFFGQRQAAFESHSSFLKLTHSFNCASYEFEDLSELPFERISTSIAKLIYKRDEFLNCNLLACCNRCGSSDTSDRR